jgi:nucleoside-diphosphate kinase
MVRVSSLDHGLRHETQVWRFGRRGAVPERCCYSPPLVDRTLVIVKPDGVERGLAGEIVSRLERKKLRLVAVELRLISPELAQTHYGEHAERPFFADLVAFFTRSPVLLMVVEGPKDTYAVVRTMMGATNPTEAAPGTIRGDLGIETTENLVHGSDSHESAAREIALFFPDLA